MPLKSFYKKAKMNNTKKPNILYVGQAYYNHWYLSRELRKNGFKADLVHLPGSSKDEHMYRGADFVLRNSTEKEKIASFIFYFWSLFEYDIFHFANTNNIKYIDFFDDESTNVSFFKKQSFRFCKMIFDGFIANKLSRLFFLKKLIGVKGIYTLLKYYAPLLPHRWDIWLIKKFGKKIVYTNNGCHDGALQTSFAKWTTPTGEPVCNICTWVNEPSVCSDERQKKWGEFRNAVTDYQCLLGGNRVDYNVSSKVHEVPQVYCLDKNFWNPDILIPTNFILPYSRKTIKILHAVGNFSTRSHAGNKSIKSTHIYIPLIERIKAEGHDVELIFFTDIPNSQMRYYQLQADIVVDMLSFGFFGANLREAMMLGKPCICYLRDEWMEQTKAEIQEYVNELPIVNANENTIYDVLVDLIKDEKKRNEIGKRGREFAIKWHSAEAGAVKMAQIYTSLT
jgi:glycosyltransferase involved in cell wall biosynthesis